MTTEEAQVTRFRSLLGTKGSRIHLMGVGGVGMAGLAVQLKHLGCDVTGCDAERGPLSAWLEGHGIEVFQQHDVSHLEHMNGLVYTPAVRKSHPELLAAEEMGLPMLRRGRVLPLVQECFPTIAVSGTHGKTTASSMVTSILDAAGRAPGYCIGGLYHGGTARPPGDVLVIEADESDGTVAFYHPQTALITNIEYDHMEHFESEASFLDVFVRFAGQAERLVYCAEDPHARSICSSMPHGISYGFSGDADFRGEILEMDGRGTRLRIHLPDGNSCELRLTVAGRHHALNAVGAAAAALPYAGAASLAQGLEAFRPPLRRFETIAERDGIRVVSDYAHHPTEIRAVLETAKLLDPKRILAVFQPHRYTRTLALGADFAPAFEGLDFLVLAPVYAASELPLEGGTTEDLYSRFFSSDDRVERSASLDEAYHRLAECMAPGDLVLVLGAGDVEKIGFRLKEFLEQASSVDY